MRMLLLAAMLAAPLGCAHRSNARDLAQRQRTTPRSDFDRGRGDSRDRGMRVEPPIVTPPVP